jgi:hypothetical protein
MKKIASLAVLSFIVHHAFSQAAAEILLFDLSAKKNTVSISHGVNITHHKGYDNQPSFHPLEPIVYYSSFNDEGRADLMSYNFKTGNTFAITKTNEREYSPTVTPDRQFLSCIIQRDSSAQYPHGAQDLGKYHLTGGPASIIIDNLIVGYHVWADNSHLGLFVLGDPQTLHYLRLPTKKDTIIAQNIGRSLHRVPHENAISFVQKISATEGMIRKLNTHTMKVSDVAPTLAGKDDLCWLPDGRILMSNGPKIFVLTPGPGATWTEIEISSELDLSKGITRLAVSPDGKKLAVVLTE